MRKVLGKNILFFFLFCFCWVLNEKRKIQQMRLCCKIYFNVYLIIVIYLLNFMNFGFIFNFFLLQHKKICTLKLIIALNFSLLRHILLSRFFVLPSLRWISIQQIWVARLKQLAGKCFFSISIWGKQNVLCT